MPHGPLRAVAANPQPLDEFLPPGINPNRGYWQDEDMELDVERNLIIGALDPRHNDADPAATGCPDNDGLAVRDPDCKSGFFVISYSDPANLTQVGDFVSLPAGHTASCIQDCKYIWTGGPARRSDQMFAEWPIITPDPAKAPSMDNCLIGDGRPIWVTDLRDPANPVVSNQPIDLWRNDGFTGLLARRRRGRAGHRLGLRPRRHPRLRDLRPPPRPLPRPRARGDAAEPDPRGRRWGRLGRSPEEGR